jgi:hypothetical protein
VVHPAREAAIMRRLANRHRGPLPLQVVVRIWREIIGASAQLQQPISIAVCCPEQALGAWDIARDYFGTSTSITAYRSAGQTIGAVGDRSAAIGVLPYPAEQDADPWWRQMLSRDPTAPRVIARLPAIRGGNARPSGDLLAIARNVELSGFDRVLIAVEFPEESSRTRLASLLKTVGLPGMIIATHSVGGLCFALAELDESAQPEDPRFPQLGKQLGVPADAILHLGGYALAVTEPAQP